MFLKCHVATGTLCIAAGSVGDIVTLKETALSVSLAAGHVTVLFNKMR
jgi:hypothetical protein